MSKTLRTSTRLLVAFAGLALIGWVDSVTGYWVTLFIFYAACVAWTTWFVSVYWGALFSVLSTAVWLWANWSETHEYTHGWVLANRVLNHTVTLLFIAFSFSFFHKTIERGKRKLTQLEGALPICSSCKRIDSGAGYWMPLDAFLRENLDARPQPKLCPDCARTQYVSGFEAAKK